MSSPLRLAAGIAGLAVVFLAGCSGAQTTSPATVPTAVPTAAPSAAPTAVAKASVAPYDTSTWVSYTSALYGYSASHPANWSEQPAANRWSSAPGGDENSHDTFWSSDGWPDFNAFETTLPAGMTADAFLASFIADGVQTACLPTLDRWTAVTIDGHQARTALGGCNEHFYFADAAAVIGNRIWIFTLDGPDRSLLQPFLTTVKINAAAATD